MSESAISASNIGKVYTLGEEPSLIDRIDWLRRMRGKPPVAREPTSFWALDDVSFDIRPGEAVGIIGHNGAGKSTLLKVLSRITEPTRGQAVIRGRVASLLEVGTGFHPDLTGRENVYMNGSILGMRRAEIARAFDDIIEFAGVERFVDTPVKRYSSGMYVRLAFSVAAHLEPEILIVDEVLAVGDVQFQKKCLGKMNDVSRSGRTVLFVSHSMPAIRQLTSRCILLKKGNVFFDGASNEAIDYYSSAIGSAFEKGSDLTDWPRPKFFLKGTVRFKTLTFESPADVFEPNSDIVLLATVEALEEEPSVRINGTIYDAENQPVGTFFCHDDHMMKAGERATFRVPLHDFALGPGRYSFSLGLVEGTERTGHVDLDVIYDLLPFEVAAIPGEDGLMGTWHRHWGPIRFPSPSMRAMVQTDPVLSSIDPRDMAVSSSAR